MHVCGTPQINDVREAPAPPSPTRGTASRRAVDADGNCLFVALAYLLRASGPILQRQKPPLKKCAPSARP